MLAIGPLSAGLARYGQALPTALDALGLLGQDCAARPASGQEPGKEHCPAHGELVSLDSVWYSYSDGREPVIRDVSLTVRPGEFIALVGPCGAGKTTLLRLLLGLENPTAGNTARTWGHEGDGPRIAYMAQDESPGAADLGTLLAGTGYAAREADIWSAAETTGLEGLLRALPMGFKTPALNLNAHFSTGQRQRMLLTRALLKDPQLLVLDEALSVLDSQSQQDIIDALGHKTMTRIVVTHDERIIRAAHRVLALDSSGRLIHDGPSELYAALLGQDSPSTSSRR
ncbi:hypothetical protein BIV23_29045 [Streptomyces monashensis]|uniref:ABC transporter domain-containing protein n=1 Tax=Streptomyces monashensis TaxID=1678012 RepID=A0A1S2Q076_9ACTN|nr:hypothetical protein BIV23_29045 [Streptomyces monashensis]